MEAKMVSIILILIAAILVILYLSSPKSQIQIFSSKCVSNNGLPDSNCTPGSIDQNVTQNDINSTICLVNYTRSIRPPTSYTDAIKGNSIVAYNYSDHNPSDYELDHLIPLEIGGNPRDPRNLWAEPHYGTFNSYGKDNFENYLRKQVCNKNLTLIQAQNEIKSNWIKYWDLVGRP